MKYFKQYLDESKAREITKEECVGYLSSSYRNPEEVLEKAKPKEKLRTMYAYFWKE